MPENPQPQPKILVIDDSRMVRMAADKILRAEFEIVHADCGESGWAQINSDPEILTVFCDLSMPGIDGFELLHRVRSDEREVIAGLPMIILTGNDEDSAREQALDLGATDFITKPFEAAQLLARARANASHDRLRRQAAALKESSTQDTITGLGNARYFRARLKAAHAYSQRHDLPMALIRVDLVGLSDRAAEHGRDAIARAIRSSGQALSAQVREEDVLVHLAPGRFAAICPNCSTDGAQGLAERLIASLRAEEATPAKVGLGATAGVHVPDNGPSTDIRTIHETAQRTADEAVKQGSGSIVMATSESTTAPAGQAPTLDEALAMITSEGTTPRLQQHLPELLERCAALFQAAPPEVAGPIVERMQEQLAASRPQQRRQSG